MVGKEGREGFEMIEDLLFDSKKGGEGFGGEGFTGKTWTNFF